MYTRVNPMQIHYIKVGFNLMKGVGGGGGGGMFSWW